MVGLVALEVLVDLDLIKEPCSAVLNLSGRVLCMHAYMLIVALPLWCYVSALIPGLASYRLP